MTAPDPADVELVAGAIHPVHLREFFTGWAWRCLDCAADERYGEPVELRSMADHAARTHQAEAVLAALAGRLLPAGAERHTQWGQEIGSVRVVLCCSDGDPDLMPTEGSCHDRVRTVFTTPWEEITDAA